MNPNQLSVALCLSLLAACGSQPETNTPAAPAAASVPPLNPAGLSTTMSDVYTLSTRSLDGKAADMSAYRGKVTLIVNVASECGYTPQYAGLQKLHTEFQERGFAVLGFPSNEFGGQEPGSPEQIKAFCTSRYAVTFPLFEKSVTKPGPQQSAIYRHLVSTSGKQPNWNFCKYLVGKNGEVLGFYPSATRPDAPELRAAIERALGS